MLRWHWITTRSGTLMTVAALALAPRLAAQASDDIWFTEPRWSPDEATLLFLAGPPGRLGVFMVDANGGNLRRIACDTAGSSVPDWAPDGRSIALTSYRDGPGAVFTYNLATSTLRRVTPAGRSASRGVWSPDGRQLALTVSDTGGRSNVWTVRSDGSNPRALTSGDNRFDVLAWTPDGSKLLITSRADTLSQLLLLPLQGGAATPVLAPTRGYIFAGHFSHDGSMIAFDAGAEIQIVRVDGTGQRNLTNHAARDFGGHWFRGDSALLFQSNRERRRNHFYELDVTSGRVTRLSLTDGWRPDAPCR